MASFQKKHFFSSLCATRGQVPCFILCLPIPTRGLQSIAYCMKRETCSHVSFYVYLFDKGLLPIVATRDLQGHRKTTIFKILNYETPITQLASFQKQHFFSSLGPATYCMQRGTCPHVSHVSYCAYEFFLHMDCFGAARFVKFFGVEGILPSIELIRAHKVS